MASVFCTYNTHKYVHCTIRNIFRPVRIHMYLYVYKDTYEYVLYVQWCTYHESITIRSKLYVQMYVQIYVHKNTNSYTHRTRTITESKSHYVHVRTCKTADVPCLQSVHCWLLLLRHGWQNSCILSRHLITTPCARNATYGIFEKLPNHTTKGINIQI